MKKFFLLVFIVLFSLISANLYSQKTSTATITYIENSCWPYAPTIEYECLDVQLIVEWHPNGGGFNYSTITNSQQVEYGDSKTFTYSGLPNSTIVSRKWKFSVGSNNILLPFNNVAVGGCETTQNLTTVPGPCSGIRNWDAWFERTSGNDWEINFDWY